MPAGYLLIVIAFLFIYVALLRPQRRRQTEQARMWESLKPGDEVVTAGGLYGTITGFQDGDPVVEIAPSLEVRVARRAIAGVTPPQDELEDEDAEDEGDDEAPDDELDVGEEPVDAAPARDHDGYPGDPR